MNAFEFTAPAKEAQAVLVVKRSKFIGNVSPAFSQKEAEKYIEEIKTIHKQASHNVFAYSISLGGLAEKASDDGEPRGTAGYPIIEVIKKRQIQNVVCVVTRYFGGTLLGTAGLVRAYSQCASAAFDRAGTAVYSYHDTMHIMVEYDSYDQVRHEINTFGAYTNNVRYEVGVTIEAYVRPAVTEQLKEKIRNLTSGNCVIEVSEGKFLPARTSATS